MVIAKCDRKRKIKNKNKIKVLFIACIKSTPHEYISQLNARRYIKMINDKRDEKKQIFFIIELEYKE